MSQLQNDFNFKKQFGQNFIFDTNFLNSLVKGFNLPQNTSVLEIGAGAGTLTEVLAQNFKKVVSVEIDKTLKPTLIPLADKYKNLNFIFNDVLSVDLTEIESQFENNYVMIANLPYYITSQIIFRFLLQSNKISQMFVMVQKEVGERFCAKNSTKDYGIPTVLINSFGSAKIVKNVGKKMFTPMPKVDSCIIEIKIDKKKFEIKDNQKYCNFVSSCFKMKRKTLYNNLSAAGFEKNKIIEAIENINLNALVRPENLTAEQFVNLFNLLN